jgi:hypothetical protein
VIDKTGSKLSDLAARDHVMLTAVQGGNATEQYHLTAAEHAALTPGFTGTGLLALQNSPTFITPALGAATATSVTSGIFLTASASASALTGVATTIIAIPNDTPCAYLVSAHTGIANDVSNYSAVAIVLANGSTARIALNNNAALLTITLSGLNVQVTQSSGGTQTVTVTLTKLGG